MDPSPPSVHRALVCTSNPHKVEELAALLPDVALEAMPAGVVLPPEIGVTFLDNARIKAHAGHAMFEDRWVLADDSGLIVDALDGAPGVRSARFAGEDATDVDNTALLLRRMAHYADPDLRTARFSCVLVMVAPDGTETVAEGTVEGLLADSSCGTEGFGYDPVFIPEGETQTFGELGSQAKARMSHRARAARQLQSRLFARA